MRISRGRVASISGSSRKVWGGRILIEPPLRFIIDFSHFIFKSETSCFYLISFVIHKTLRNSYFSANYICWFLPNKIMLSRIILRIQIIAKHISKGPFVTFHANFRLISFWQRRNFIYWPERIPVGIQRHWKITIPFGRWFYLIFHHFLFVFPAWKVFRLLFKPIRL